MPHTNKKNPKDALDWFLPHEICWQLEMLGLIGLILGKPQWFCLSWRSGFYDEAEACHLFHAAVNQTCSSLMSLSESVVSKTWFTDKFLKVEWKFHILWHKYSSPWYRCSCMCVRLHFLWKSHHTSSFIQLFPESPALQPYLFCTAVSSCGISAGGGDRGKRASRAAGANRGNRTKEGFCHVLLYTVCLLLLI